MSTSARVLDSVKTSLSSCSAVRKAEGQVAGNFSFPLERKLSRKLVGLDTSFGVIVRKQKAPVGVGKGQM